MASEQYLVWITKFLLNWLQDDFLVNQSRNVMVNPLIINPYCLSRLDNPNMAIRNLVVDGTNYLGWSKSIKSRLGAKIKLDFVNGLIVWPKESSLDFIWWNSVNDMVKC